MTELKVKVGRLLNEKASGKDEFIGEMVKGGNEFVIDWIWKLYNMTFEIGVMSEDCRSVMIGLLCKGGKK